VILRGFPEYHETINRTFVALAATPLGDGPFAADLDATGGHQLQVTRVRATPHRVRRTEKLIDAAAGGYALASIQVSGRSAIEQDGRRAVLTPGSLAFCDSTRPFALSFDSSFAQVVVQVPRVGTPALRRATAVRLDGSGPAAAVVAFFTALAGIDPAPVAAPAVALMEAALALAAGDPPDSAELDRARVKEHLRLSYRDPSLNADAVAGACHLSRRALFRLFENESDSLADEIRKIRIGRARELLRAHPAMSVAEIAPACGFTSETQLHRAFRAVTGRTPGAWRSGT
jgi:AraC-like DNA-binding protein